ncbi:hypothetical protein PUMCH_004045 [Australozyma saopauloensis]|uniref:ubiquitinyl hydrolase 1 n=1 Tax=Australozyma saopauloensis TaxID=291208 RepID=A0AAX4HGB7_9ASCO|nr:hypothetical protein PUMCH_004045 [[Candida] saopauloensis]
MLRKRLSRWTSRTEGGDAPQSDFNDVFWTSYVDLLARNASGNRALEILPVNTKKYSSSSSAVAQVRALFPPELPQPSTAQIVALLKSPFSQGGNVTRAFFFIRVFQLSMQGFFITNDGVDLCGNKIQLLGAENWENVMCYMDALLFSMFAKLDSFEPVLFLLNQSPNPLVGRLSALLRVYVNLLRLGSLITTDLSQAICECLAALGFTEATSHRQQDCAPLFEFLTETLAMPLLTFRVEIQHSGKHDDDDRRYSKERILFVSVPEPASDEDHTPDSITLEECLEHYFNNSISVKRELQRRATLDSQPSLPEGEIARQSVGAKDFPTLDRVRRGMAESSSDSKLSSNRMSTAKEEHSVLTTRSSQVRVRTRSSTLSIWSINSFENKSQEVMLPAWMLLRLLPFYTDDNDTCGGSETFAKSSQEFANRRPVLPICLKRYSFSKSDKKANRSKRRIIIPPVINLPLFVAEDDDSNENLASGFKLVLESAVCHRGTSIESGHFVSAVRVKTSLEDESSEDSLLAPWYLYDDMRKTGRVVVKSFKELFDTEWPYILFYRLVASNDTTMRKTSYALSGHPSHMSSPVIAPKGAKSNFWSEADSEPAQPQDESKEPETGPSIVVETIHNCAHNSGQVQTVPAKDLLPTSPKYIDIRKRYLWYVTDRKKNYYKESAAASKTGSNISISVTPQFRRNSQWSNLSNISGLALENRECLEKDHLDPPPEELVKEKHAGQKSKTHSLKGLSRESSTKERKHHIHRIFSHDKEDQKMPHQRTKLEKDSSKCHIM